MGQACPKQSSLWWGWCPYADADIREMRTSTIGGFLMEPSILEVAYLPSLLAEWELKSPAGKCLAVWAMSDHGQSSALFAVPSI